MRTMKPLCYPFRGAQISAALSERFELYASGGLLGGELDRVFTLRPAQSRLPGRRSKTVGTIVIGNPEVVDATLQGRNAILLTAKKITGSAATNLIVLNAQDAEIFNATIVVGSQGGTKTEIHSKGKAGGLHEYWAYRCMPTCERVEDKLETFQRSAAAPPAASPAVVVTPGTGSAGSDASQSDNTPQY